MAKHWIQDAVSKPGSFTRQAKAAGKSVSAFAHEKEDAPGKTGKRARLALVLRGLRNSHKG